MEELLKYAVEGGGFGISLFLTYVLFKKFIKAEVVEPIAELKEENSEIKKSFNRFTEQIMGFVFKVIKGHADLIENANRNSANMNNLFSESSRQSSQARRDSLEAIEKVNVMEKTADKLLKIATAVHEKNKSIETEVLKLSNDMIMVKTKVGVKDEE